MIRAFLKIDSLILKEPVEISVFLPQPLTFKNSNFKVLWCLHSIFSDSSLFTERLDLLDLVNYGYILVCPSLSNSYYMNAECRNVADFLDIELYPYLQELFPLPTEKKNNICMGISMGAFGALTWSLRKQSYFSRIILVVGYYDFRLPLNSKLKLYRREQLLSNLAEPYIKSKLTCKDGSLLSAADIRELLRNVELDTFPKVDFYCGSEDYISKDQTAFYFDLMKSQNMNVSMTFYSGSHDVKSWRNAMPIIFSELRS